MRLGAAIGIAAALAVTCAAAPAKDGPNRPCAITGISTDADVKGLRIRAAPDRRSRVVGVLLPAMDPHVFYHDDKAGLAEGLVGAQFTVTKVSGDWLRIADIDPVTDGIGPDGSLEPVPNYGGEGWVHASKVELLSKGPADAFARPDPASARVSGTGGIGRNARIIACRGDWARVRDAGVSGWVKSQSNKARAAQLRAALKPRNGGQ